MGGSSNQDYSKSFHIGRNILVSIAKYLLHGSIMLAALMGLDQYISIMLLNSVLGNYIPFLPHILIICILLVFLLIGTLNQLVTVKLWNVEASGNWLFLMGQGIVLVILMILSIVVTFTIFYVTPIPSYGFTLSYAPLPYVGFNIPVFGFISKFLMTTGTGRK